MCTSDMPATLRREIAVATVMNILEDDVRCPEEVSYQTRRTCTGCRHLAWFEDDCPHDSLKSMAWCWIADSGVSRHSGLHW